MEGGRQDHRRRHVGLEGLLPAGGAQTPAVARPQTREAPGLVGRAEIVADQAAVVEEVRGHHHADRVHADVVGAGITAACAVETGEGVRTATLERSAEDILLPAHD